MTNQRQDELSYECGWLKGSMQHAEQKLARLREMSLSHEVLMVILGDVINDLRTGREGAANAAKTQARELWIDRRIDQEKMEAAADAADALRD